MLDPFLTDLLQETRALALTFWHQGAAVEAKVDRSLVTEADWAIERLIRDRIARAFPADGVYGEEFGTERLGADRIWVVDPIDGTQAFVLGVPVFSTLIALVQGGRVVQAAADFPALDLCFTAARGAGARLNGEPIRVRSCTGLAAATLTATSPTLFTPQTDPQGRFGQLLVRVGSVRFGLDAYGFCSLARGRLDLAVEAGLQPYDYLAPSLIVTEAGGVMTDWSGRPLGLEGDGSVAAAATPALHRQALS